MPNLRLIKAEVLKLRRRPGMLTVAFGLTLGLLALAYLVTAIQHGGNPAKYDAAGGAQGLHRQPRVPLDDGLHHGRDRRLDGRVAGHRLRRLP